MKADKHISWSYYSQYSTCFIRPYIKRILLYCPVIAYLMKAGKHSPPAGLHTPRMAFHIHRINLFWMKAGTLSSWIRCYYHLKEAEKMNRISTMLNPVLYVHVLRIYPYIYECRWDLIHKLKGQPGIVWLCVLSLVVTPAKRQRWQLPSAVTQQLEKKFYRVCTHQGHWWWIKHFILGVTCWVGSKFFKDSAKISPLHRIKCIFSTDWLHPGCWTERKKITLNKQCVLNNNFLEVIKPIWSRFLIY